MTKIKILGTGCPRCRALQSNVEEAVRELDMTAKIEKVTNMGEILAHGVASTPGLIVDGEIKGSGRILSKEEIKEILKETLRR